MLKTTKTVQLSGQSVITTETEGQSTEQVVVYMNATVPEEGTVTISKTIQNKTLYDVNKTACRKDMDDFEDKALSVGGEA